MEDGKELVAFPGVNAPIPDGADPGSWVSYQSSFWLNLSHFAMSQHPGPCNITHFVCMAAELLEVCALFPCHLTDHRHITAGLKVIPHLRIVQAMRKKLFVIHHDGICICWQASTAPQPLPAPGSKRAQPEHGSSMLPPPPLKRLRTAEGQPRFLPTAAAHESTSGYDSPHAPSSSHPIAASLQPLTSAAHLAASGSHASAALPFAAGPYISEAQRAHSNGAGAQSESHSVMTPTGSASASNTFAAIQTSQAALQDQFTVASHFAASRAYGVHPPPPASLPPASLLPPGMYTGMPYSYAPSPDAYSAYASYANYAAHAARLASGAYLQHTASPHPYPYGVHMPAAYPYGQPAPPSSTSGAPPPPPSYDPPLPAPPHHHPQQ